MKIAIIGSGNVGKALGGAAARAGHEVTLAASSAAHAAGVVSELGAALEGKTVVDVTNRVNPGDPGSVLDGDSLTEQIMVLVPRANFVKAFNTLFASVMANPTVEGVAADAYIAGDDAGAKASVSELAKSMGFRPLDVGPAAIARVLEGMGLLNVLLQINNGWPWQSSWKLVGPTGDV
jgi:8-hydroxy-5-deazaflavin:NADPH oxidoreductase